MRSRHARRSLFEVEPLEGRSLLSGLGHAHAHAHGLHGAAVIIPIPIPIPQTFQGLVVGKAGFIDGKSPANGFYTTSALGAATQIGPVRMSLQLNPVREGGAGITGYTGSATLYKLRGAPLTMNIQTGTIASVSTPDGQLGIAALAGTYTIPGGTGSLARGDITVTINCDFRKLEWTITISWKST